MRKFLSTLKKAAITSIALFFIIALFSTGVGSLLSGHMELGFIFTSNFIGGVVIITAGIVMELWPVRLPKKSKLIDHTTHTEYVLNKRAEKREKGNYMIYMGIFHVFISALVQFVLSLIIR